MMQTRAIFLVFIAIFTFSYGHILHDNIKDEIGTYVKSAAWKSLGWKADMEGLMTLSLLHKYEIPLKGSLKGKGNLLPFRKFNSCTDIRSFKSDATDGVYTIYPDGKTAKSAYCDMKTEGGGWTVFQRRFDGSVDFYKEWNDYKTGFGNTSSEYWLGNDALHELTQAGTCTLRIDLVTLANEKAYSKFSNFTISSENDGYKMDYNKYSGTAGDALSYHKGMNFTTNDRDNDKYGRNCAREFKGAWWYKSCHHSNLNGLYGGSGNTYMRWWDWKNTKKDRFMKKTVMMIKC